MWLTILFISPSHTPFQDVYKMKSLLIVWGSFYVEGSLEVEELIVFLMGKDYVTVLLSVIYDIEI